GWTLQGNGTDADVVKPGDKVNFINGAATVVTITPDAAGTASEVKVDVAVDDSTIKIVDGKLTATATKPSVTANADGDINFVNTNTTNVTVDPTTGDIKIDVVTTPLTTNATTGKVDTPANPNATATAGDIATAVNNSGWTAAVNKTGTGVSTDKGGDKLVNPGDTVTFIAGNNMNITKEGLNYTIATNENVTFNNVNASNINVGPVTINNVTGINAGNLTITNVAPGVNATDAVNVQQLKDTLANSTTQVINGDGSVTVAPNETNTNVYEITVNTDGQTIGKVTAEDVAKDPTLTEGALKVITTPLTVNNSTGAVNTPANPNAMATAGDIANAINGSGFTLTAQGANGSLVNPGETVDMKNTDGNIVISKSADSNDVVYNLANDVKVGNSVTTPKVNADTVTIGNVANPSAPSTTLTTVAGGNYNSAGQLVDGTATPALSVGGNQITNVANGAITPTSTDAINGSQLYALGSNINNQVNQVAGRVEQIGKQADRGAAIAGAMGMLPQPHLPGKSLVAVATTRYRGQQAAAIGYSRLSDNGKHIIKVSGSTGVNSGAGGRSTMVGAAYGYQW
ncbi:MAG: YadA-like family protein, partial [Pelistega sp.]|nr:YadA-like family protein [Pelistega sp.]